MTLMPTPGNARRRLLLIVLVAVAARAMTFGNPIVHVDEQYYFMVGRAMWSGAVPFIDLWDRKPYGLFLLYMPPAALPGIWGILAYQAMALGAVVGTAWLVARFADRAGWERGATYAAFAYILWLNLLSGAGGQSPVFYNLPIAAAAMLAAVPSPGGRDRARGLAAMALIGVALQIKYSVVFEGIFIGLWLLWRDWRAGRPWWSTLGYGIVLVALALIPTAIVAAAYAHIGAIDEFVFANFLAIFARKSNPPGEMFGNLGTLLLILSPLVAMGTAAWRHRRDGEGAIGTFLVLWMLASAFGVLVFGTWYDHYGLPVVAPASACAAWFLGAGKWRGRATPAILLTAALAGQIKVIADRLNRGSPAEFAQLVDAVGRGPGCLYIHSGYTMLQAATDRCWDTAYVFPSFLLRPREAGAMGVDQVEETRRILAKKPAVIVMSWVYPAENMTVRGLVKDALRRDYRPPIIVPMGDQSQAVYHRR